MNKDELFRINTMYCEDYFKTLVGLVSDRTFKAAWQTIEIERIEIGLPERYTTYNSFRKAFHLHTNKVLLHAKTKKDRTNK
jgi:hypothetical protein